MARPKGVSIVAFINLAYGGLNGIFGLVLLTGWLLEVTDPQGNYHANYTYDALYQLTSESGTSTHSYQYDSRHHRLQKIG